MKKFYITALIFCFSCLTFPQENNFAYLSDIQVGLHNADSDFQKVINDINRSSEIKFVVITGNLTAHGSDEELSKAKEILDNLTIPYHVIPGPNDLKSNESGLTKFKELWLDDKFSFDLNDIKYIGINSSIPGKSGYAHFSPEDLDWFAKILTSTDKSQKIYLYTYNPPDSAVDNWFQITNLVREKNIKAVFTGCGTSFNIPASWNKISTLNGIPSVTGRSAMAPAMEEPKTKKKTKGSKPPVLSWGYTLVKDNPDSLLFYEINSDSIQKYWGGIAKKNKLNISSIDSLQFNIYSNKIIKKWDKELNSAIYAPIYSAQERIFSVSQKGIVNCFDTDGNLKWKYDTGGTILSPPVRDNDVLSLAVFEGDLFSFNVNNGKVIQVLSTGENLTSQLIKIETVNSDGLKTRGVIVGCSSGKIICYDMYSFEQIWENSSAKGVIESQPLFINNKIIYASRDGYLYCIDGNNGALNWKWAFGKKAGNNTSISIPVSDGKNVYMVINNSLLAVDLLLGTTAWENDDFNYGKSINISSDAQKLYIKSTNDAFYVLAPKSGNLIKEINAGFGEDKMPGTPLEWKGNVFFTAKNGIVYFIDNHFICIPLFFLGTADVNTIINIHDNIFAASNIDGKIFVFEMK